MYPNVIFLRTLNNSNTLSVNTTASVANHRSVKLAILLPCQVLSLLFSLFIFMNVVHGSYKLFRPVRNHFIAILLITGFIQVSTELSMVENYLHTGVVRPSTPSYCSFFNWFEFSLNGISLHVMFWTSIERHILIFFHASLRTPWKCLLFHYIPLLTSVAYAPSIYGYFIFIYECVNHWDYNELLCTAPCFYENKLFGIVTWLANIIIPAFSIAAANIILIVRVTCRSADLQINIRRIKKNRKMTIQLLGISSLFLIFWLPISVTGLIQQFFSPTFLIDVQFNVFFYLIYFIQLFLPFVCFVSLPELKSRMKQYIRRLQGRNAIGAMITLQVAPTMRY
ncbi:unnamed protein product [Adineta ricciae]|uniref:G-protein coupled receptors family 1 profile domain-containing protein n=1 Tax=Adineta ricciae TaxID=249248 RepID=A0A815RUE4_ADIRI|nr:unnamed protein product [Adineta ricciae]CAF1479648.1 unnamed protein product [Adineta ricciae]